MSACAQRFHTNTYTYTLNQTVLDEGPFERLAEEHLPEDAKDKWKTVARTLPQSGLSVTTVRKKSLPTGMYTSRACARTRLWFGGHVIALEMGKQRTHVHCSDS